MKFKEFLSKPINNECIVEDNKEYTIAGNQNYGQGLVNRKKVFGHELTMKNYQVLQSNQLMWCKVDTKNGAFGITSSETEGSLASSNMAVFDINISKVYPEFLQLFFQIPSFYEYINFLSTGSTNRKYLKPSEVLEQLTIPTMSLTEQEQFIERYKKIKHKEYILTNEFQTQSNLITKLRASILSDAVSGRLVSQDQTDESASVLLERIKAEKERLIKEGELKRDKLLVPITANEIPYELPVGWVWCRLDDIASVKGGKRLPAGKTFSSIKTDHIYARVTDMQNGTILDNDIQYLPDNIYEQIKAYYIETTDVYLVIVGSTIGKTGLVPDVFHRANLTENAVKLTPHLIDKNFLYLTLKSSNIQAQFFDKTFQLGQPKLAINRIKSTLFPLPPLAEQDRIVAKIEQLMATCDALETEVAKSRAETDRLMQTILKEAFDR